MALSAAYRPKLGAFDSPGEDQGARRLRFAIACAAALLALEVALIPLRSPRFAVRQVVLRGDPRVTAMVAPRLALRPNTNFFRAPTRRLARLAESLPAVQHATVARHFPARLVVTVEKREPVAVVRRADEAKLVDPNGVVFSVRDEWGWGLPELVGSKLTQADIGSEAGKAQIAVLLGVLRQLGPDPRLRVARLEMASDGRIEAALEAGAQVRFGDIDNMDVKIRLLSSALDQLGVKRIAYIDLSNPRNAFWRERGSKS